MDDMPAGTDLSPFTEEEEMFRRSVRAFLDKELEPGKSPCLYVSKLTITEKSNDSLWITSKVSIYNIQLELKCSTWNILHFHMKTKATGHPNLHRRPTPWNRSQISYLCHNHEPQAVRMATGWAPDGAVQEQIDDSITDEVMRARARMPAGEGSTHCVECGEEIPPARRRAMPGVRTCVPCQSAHDRLAVNPGINRRANKDSQLR